MKNFVKFFAVIVFCTVIYSPLFAQEQMPEMTSEQKAWMDYMAPGPEHAMMAKAAGEWKVKTTAWEKPGDEPVVSEGTSKSEMILGGRYFKEEFEGSAWGMPMSGINIMAFDNSTKEYVSTWVDNMGTGITMSKGKWDDEAKAIVMWGSMVDPTTGGEMKYKSVIKTIDDNNNVFEMYMIQDGQEFKTFLMESTRVK
ncbi:MAG: hypothetical protein A2068_08850 [Ignavibacteria bacterium GWB2_35_6b]|nr:MAG: hypothetical protein A2068_08850 [Ignavibacteria bacterium GWB2_35_6b]